MRPRIAFLSKKSAWSTLVAPHRASSTRMRTLVAKGDPTVARMRSTHDAHQRTLAELHDAFSALGVQAVLMDDALEVHKRTSRGRGRSGFDLVVTVGGDGTLLRASHAVSDVPILGINSAPTSSVGFFCGVKGGDGVSVHRAIERALEGRLPASVLTRMRVAVGRKVVSDRVLNDALFCHKSPAATSRYIIEVGDEREEHKSSGFWVGPAAGSTAAQRSAGGRVLPLKSRLLQLVVREPYTPKGEKHELLHVLAEPGTSIVVRSKMREACLFLDGPDLAFSPEYGDVITFEESPEPLTLLARRTKQ